MTDPGRVLRLAAVVAMALLCTGCGGAAGTATEEAGTADLRGELVVHAAASLSDAFDDLATTFEDRHPGVEVTLNLAGSQALATQVEQGAPGGVLASADTVQMDRVRDLLAGPPQEFATNHLVVVVPSGNPAAVTGLADLTRSDLTVVLAAEDVPAGRYTAQLLAGAGLSVTPASLELDVRSVQAKVATGDADAGVVYATDAAANDRVEVVEVDGADEVEAHYPIAVLPDQQDLGAAFVDLVVSDEGRAVLVDHGFGLP